MQAFFLRNRAYPAIAGLMLAAGISTMLLLVDAFSPAELPRGFSTDRQLLGINLLLILLPSYFLFAWGFVSRRSWELLGQVDELIPDQAFQARLATPVSALATGGAIGLVYAVLFNLPVNSVDQLIEGGPLLITLVSLIIVVWVSTGLIVSSRLHASGLFRQAGSIVALDPYDQSPLEPFARSGMGDMLLAIGALVLSTVQSIDATFRLGNYLYALAVGIPAGLILLLRPMSTIHARLKAYKRDELAELARLIRAAPKTLDRQHIEALEPLLQRRERIHGIATWPLNISMVSRLIIYGVIPPAAWIGAALMERLIEELLSSG